MSTTAHALVPVVDIAGGQLVIDPPGGLFELFELLGDDADDADDADHHDEPGR